MRLDIDMAVEMTATAIETADAVVRLIGKATDGLDAVEQPATRMVILQLLLAHAARSVGAQVNRHPREIVERLVEEVFRHLPEKPVEERPTRPSRTKGPSPWSAVR